MLAAPNWAVPAQVTYLSSVTAFFPYVDVPESDTSIFTDTMKHDSVTTYLPYSELAIYIYV